MPVPARCEIKRRTLAACLLILLSAVSVVGAGKPLPLTHPMQQGMGGNRCPRGHFKTNGHFETSLRDDASELSGLETYIKTEEAFFCFWWGC